MPPTSHEVVRLHEAAEPRPRREVGPPFKKLLGGWVCLDFVNTVSAWVPAAPGRAHGPDDRPEGERLTGYGAVLRWAAQAGVLDASSMACLQRAGARRPGEAAAVVARALALRAALYRLFGTRLLGRALGREDLDVLEGELERMRHGERLVESDDGTVGVAWMGGDGDLDAVLWPVLRSAVALLSSRPALERLGQCDGERCGWLFVDVSRGGRRRWCDMADCGNVAKVRTHRAKRRRGP